MKKDNLIDKLKSIRKTLNSRVLERKNETDGILLALLSGTSALFLGDVGTAKTTHIRLASQMFGLRTFDILLSETTKPDQIFGPTDIPALAQGRQVTKIKGYAPDSEVLFFDEIFKANAVVLNPLLWLVNEKQYRNGDDGIISCPVKAVFAASNEIPVDPVLRAIYDRFILRYEVTYVKDQNNQKKMLNNFLATSEKVKTILSPEEVKALRKAVRKVEVPNEVLDVLIKIREQVQTACSTKISDRRLNQSVRVIQAHAVLKGRMQARISDTEVVANIFWDKPEHQTKVQAIALAHASSDISDVLSYEELAQSVMEVAMRTGNMEAALPKLKRLFNSVKDFQTKSGQLIATQIKSKIQQCKSVIDQRANFVVVRIKTSGKVWFKLSTASATVWTATQLRGAGFHHKRNGGYWYYKGTQTSMIANAQKKLGVQVAIKDLIIKKD